MIGRSPMPLGTLTVIDPKQLAQDRRAALASWTTQVD